MTSVSIMIFCQYIFVLPFLGFLVAFASALDLLLAPCSGVTPSRVHGIILGDRGPYSPVLLVRIYIFVCVFVIVVFDFILVSHSTVFRGSS